MRALLSKPSCREQPKATRTSGNHVVTMEVRQDHRWHCSKAEVSEARHGGLERGVRDARDVSGRVDGRGCGVSLSACEDGCRVGPYERGV